MNLSTQSACFIYWMKVAQFIVWAAAKWPPCVFAEQHNGKAEAVNVEKHSHDKSVTLLLSSAALSSLSLAIIQLNSSQASAALAVRGRFLDARREGELQRQLIERAMWVTGGMEDTLTDVSVWATCRTRAALYWSLTNGFNEGWFYIQHRTKTKDEEIL